MTNKRKTKNLQGKKKSFTNKIQKKILKKKNFKKKMIF